MRRALALLAAAVLLPGSGAAALSYPPALMSCSGSGRVRTCTVSSGAKVRDKTVRVVLPASYSPHKRYPVVYVLHGVGDDETTWTNPARGDLAALTSFCEAIFVTPDGGSGREAGWYSDWKSGAFEWERFHVADLPKAVDRTFATRGRGYRAVVGNSMGGFGAMSYAARHPNTYRAAASYSGFLDSMFLSPASGTFFDVSGQNAVYTTGTPHRDVWGQQTLDEATWRAHNPWDLAPRLRHTSLYLSGGTGVAAPAAPASTPGHAVEAYTRHLTDRFADRLKAEGIGFVDARYDGGTHDWSYWRASLKDSLRVLMPALDARPC